MHTSSTHVAFLAERRIAVGPLADVLAAVKSLVDASGQLPVMVFENETGRQVDFDLRGTLEDVLHRARPVEPPRPPGRPKLGVEGREVTLLPRHWAWLQRQPGGASAALRRLVEEASRRDVAGERARRARDATYGIMSALAGDRVGFEEAARALFAGEIDRFSALIEAWPEDVRDHLRAMLARGEPVADGHGGPSRVT